RKRASRATTIELTMGRRNSSLGFLGRFGRSEDLRRLDHALRAVDLHPALVPEGVKLTIVNLMKDRWPRQEPPAEAYPPVAELFGCCVLGSEAFGRVNGPAATAAAEQRLQAALEDDTGLDAQLVLLALHARLIHPDMVDRYGFSADE